MFFVKKLLSVELKNIRYICDLVIEKEVKINNSWFYKIFFILINLLLILFDR